MHYQIKGNLSAYLGAECFENLSRVRALIYLPVGKTETADRYQDIKIPVEGLSDREIKSKEDRLIAQAETNLQGNFLIDIEEKYVDSALEIDIYFDSLTLPCTGNSDIPEQFHLTSYVPEWETTADGQDQNAHFDYRIAADWWLKIKERYFGASAVYRPLAECQKDMSNSYHSAGNVEVDFMADDWDETFENATDISKSLTPQFISQEFSWQLLSMPKTQLLQHLRVAIMFIFS